ncbi:MAG TPA: DUF4340 domain-containing protein [Stellaceae bacterium]|nr:DUF4340 domain-containing protein [Stellaceae bacterium]
MQRRGFRLLVLAAVAIAGLAVFIASRGDRDVSHAPAGRRALPALADRLGDLAWLRLTRGAMTANFSLINKQWTVVEKGNYPADQERVRKLLVQLAECELIEAKTDKPELLARLDLDDPANGKSTLVTAQDRTGGLVAQLIVGAKRPSEIGGGDAGVYVRKPGSDQAWLARGSFDLAGDALSWLDRRIIDIRPARIASVVLTTADGKTVTVARGSADLPLAIDTPPENVQPKDDAALAAPAGALESLTLDDVRPAAEHPIAEDGAATAAFTTFDGLIVGLRLSPNADPSGAGNWVAIDVTGSGKAEAEGKALSAKLSRWSFAISAERAKLLRTTLTDLLQPHGS